MTVEFRRKGGQQPRSVQPRDDVTEARSQEAEATEGYEPPEVLDLGKVRNVVLGSAGGGRNDQNGQYYYG
ncbi:MAG: hypothetical protein ACJ73S_26350 [Mycobacteriales bacterium]|jgi:hypothetical protein